MKRVFPTFHADAMDPIVNQLNEVRQRMMAACRAVDRDPASVELIAVSKTFPAEAVRVVHDAGQCCFGESRLQEAEPKIAELPTGLNWHFIGRVQSNKVRKILPLFEVVHGIDSARLASHVNRVAEDLGLKPKVFLQVNIGRETSKGGFDPDGIEQEMGLLLALQHLEIMGLMCIPPAGPDAESSRQWFVALRELRDRMVLRFGKPMDFLSMGMSNDYDVAIEEGATHVRVGSAIFGNRSYRVDGELG